MAASASEARRFSLAALATWGLSALDDTVALLVTELVSNGVRYAGTRLELVLTFDGRCLRVAVADEHPYLPDTKARRGLPIGGWGLKLVDALSTEWGTDIHGGGKAVWFEIDVSEIVSEAESRREGSGPIRRR